MFRPAAPSLDHFLLTCSHIEPPPRPPNPLLATAFLRSQCTRRLREIFAATPSGSGRPERSIGWRETKRVESRSTPQSGSGGADNVCKCGAEIKRLPARLNWVRPYEQTRAFQSARLPVASPFLVRRTFSVVRRRKETTFSHYKHTNRHLGKSLRLGRKIYSLWLDFPT